MMNLTKAIALGFLSAYVFAGCSVTSPGDAKLSTGAPPSLREILNVPQGTLLCYVRGYKTKTAQPDMGTRFHKAILRLNKLLEENGVDYDVFGFLANMYYIGSDDSQARHVILKWMKMEAIEVTFH